MRLNIDKGIKLALKPDNNKAFELFQKAFSAEKRGELANAISLLEESIALFPAFDKAFNRLGLIYSKLESREKAIYNFTIAAKILPNEKSFYNLAVEFYKAKELDKSIEVLKKNIANHISHIESYLLLAHIFKKQKNDHESVNLLNDVIKIDSKNKSALGGLVVLFFDIGNFSDSLKYAGIYLSLYPGDSRILLIKTEALLQTGNIEESGELLKKIAMEDPGFTSFTEKINKKQALPEEKKFFENLKSRTDKKLHEFEAKLEMSQENPDDFSAPDSQDAMDLSLLYLFNGETEKALEYLMYAKKSAEV